MLLAFLFPLSVSASVVDRQTIDFAIEKLSAVYQVDETTVHALVRCESNYVATAVSHTRDHGLLQINERAHKARMSREGYDLYNWQSSLEWGIKLLYEQGTAPWYSSRRCWLPILS